jgi:hypothetical protein
MGSHYVSVCSLDDQRVRGALGSADRKVRTAWLRLIRKEVGRVEEQIIEAREEAAEAMIAGDYAPGARPDGHHFEYALVALCEGWADAVARIECHVHDTFPVLWYTVAQAQPNPFGIPYGEYSPIQIGWHSPAEVTERRAALAQIDMDNATRRRSGCTPQNVAAIDKVLAHAEKRGRGAVVVWIV